MIDLAGLPVLDVAIGLAFLYFLLSIVCSSIQEIIAGLFRLRARNLEAGLRAMLGSPKAAAAFLSDWRIRSLCTPKWRDATKQQKSRSPSYLDPRTVSLVVVDTFVPDAALAAGKEDPDQPPSADALAAIGAAVKDVEDPGAREWLARIVADARGDVDAVRTRVEDHFNQLMDRATGWYKREVQVILFVVALAVAGMLNADTINVADRLSRDEAVRAQVVAQAQRAGQGPPPKGTPTAATIERQIEAARATALPLGWGGENVPNGGVIGVVAVKALGLVITAFALMLAAPFWFDVLGKFARLRSTGNRIGTRKDDDLAPTDRDDRTARRSRAGAR